MGMVQSRGEKIFQVLNVILLLLIAGATLYPFWYVFIVSISGSNAIMAGKTMLLPRDVNLDSYKEVLHYPDIWNTYANTLFYTIVGTFVNMALTVFAAYPLARKKFVFKKFFLLMVTITMFFQGGIIPTYIVVNKLGLTDNRWGLIIPTAIMTWFLIILRSFFMAIPDSMEESAKIDGASDLSVLFRIILPLSKAGLAIIALYYAVFHWNDYFNALMYINKKELYPLTITLTHIVLQNDTLRQAQSAGDIRPGLSVAIRYATIVVAVLPILLVYPYIQKYFVKGVMLGSIKG